MDILCTELLQLYSDSFETLQVFRPWFEDVQYLDIIHRLVLLLFSQNVLSHFFPPKVNRYSVSFMLLSFYSKYFETLQMFWSTAEYVHMFWIKCIDNFLLLLRLLLCSD